MTHFIRTEDGTATNVTKADGLAEVNRCMMDGKREVAEMTAVSGYYMIWYKDGRKVTLSRQDGDMPKPAEEPTAEPIEDQGVRVVSFNGGKVHTLMPDSEEHPWPLCRGGGMNQMLTKFHVTTAPLSCTHCVEYARRRAARLAREAGNQ